MKSLDIDLYKDGYGLYGLDCIHIPIAYASGFFNRDSYFFYAFYYIFYNNWQKSGSDNFLSYNNFILNKIGLQMKEISINDTDQLVNEIENSIDNKSPVMLMVDYYALFYDELNYKTIHNPHGILVSEYDSSRKLFVLRENTYGQDYYARFVLKYSDVCEIWRTSVDFSPAYCHKIFVFKKIKDIKPKLLDLLSYFLDEFNPNKDSLIDLITNDKYHINNLFAIKTFANSFFEFFNILEKCADLLELSPQSKDSFANFKEKYIRTRQNIILKIQTYNLRKKNLTEDLKKSLIEKIISDNTALLKFVDTLNAASKKSLDINLSLGKKVYADSEQSNLIGYSGKERIFGADRVVNGKWNNYLTDQWRTENVDTVHWLKVDLEAKKTVNKFVVRHDTKQMYLTKDFKIQGSNDDRDWHDIVSVENNSQVTSIHKIDPVSYRYFRLYITKPGTNDYSARIYEFEIWGED